MQKTFNSYGGKGLGLSAKKKKNIAKVDFGGIKFDVDVNESWKELQCSSLDDQRHEILTEWHFLIQFCAMDNLAMAIKKRFLKFFIEPAAAKARSVALMGLTHTNYEKEFDLLVDADEFYKKRANSAFTDQANAVTSMILFALPFAEIISKRDVTALRRMIAIIESKGMPDGTRGGSGSEDGYMLEKLCDLHLATRSLPTKKALRKACGLDHLTDEKLASKRMKKLGLWGLPTEPEI